MYSERLITAAAKWWGNTLRTKSSPHVLGSDSNTMERAAVDVFTALLPKVPENKIKVFETELVFTIRAEIMRLFQALKQYPDRLIVSVDYDPCKVLAQAAQKANFDPKYVLPMKTCMYITEAGEVTVRHGVDAPLVEYCLLDGQLVRK